MKSTAHSFWMPRRVRRLAELISERVRPGSHVLDLGCGSGELASEVLRLVPDLRFTGADVVDRLEADIEYVPILPGQPLPFDDHRFDSVLLIDVLHHTDDPGEVLQEAARVGDQVVVKDHFESGSASRTILRTMDWFGNPKSVGVPRRYLDRQAWTELTSGALIETVRHEELLLYPKSIAWLVERDMHFLSVVTAKKESDNASQPGS